MSAPETYANERVVLVRKEEVMQAIREYLAKNVGEVLGLSWKMREVTSNIVVINEEDIKLPTQIQVTAILDPQEPTSK